MLRCPGALVLMDERLWYSAGLSVDSPQIGENKKGYTPMTTAPYPPLSIKIWGDLACFTRPEMKTERVSYPVITPSAARGVVEAIFWKPEIRWQIVAIHVLRPIRYIGISRSEVKAKQSYREAVRWSRTGVGGYVACEDHTPRHTLALRDVAYIIEAQALVQPHTRAEEPKYRDMLRRRVQRGQCFVQPSLGLREFVAWFGPASDDEPALDLTEDFGLMLHDLRYDAEGRGTPVFFRARLERGIMRVPPLRERRG